jgi:DNA-binding response OmpR family regulator
MHFRLAAGGPDDGDGGDGGDGALTGVKVLVVEDEFELRELLAETLNDHGAETRTAATAEEALALDELGEMQALVADIGLPGMDGLELLRALRRTGSEMPAVALTGFAEQRRVVLEAGYQVYVTKPVNRAGLVAAVVAALGRVLIR